MLQQIFKINTNWTTPQGHAMPKRNGRDSFQAGKFVLLACTSENNDKREESHTPNHLCPDWVIVCYYRIYRVHSYDVWHMPNKAWNAAINCVRFTADMQMLVYNLLPILKCVYMDHDAVIVQLCFKSMMKCVRFTVCPKFPDHISKMVCQCLSWFKFCN